MATVTLYDGASGDPLAAANHAEPVASADVQEAVAFALDHETVSFALDPLGGTAMVRLAVDPRGRRVVAGIDLDEDDALPDLHRAVQRRLAGTDHRVALPGESPPHLNVFHYLAAPDPASPDAEIRGHLVSTDDPVEVGAPTAAEAAGVAAFFRERAPWKSIVVHSGEATVPTDPGVTVVVDDAFDGVTYPGRGEGWVDEEAPAEPLSGPTATGGAGKPAGSGTDAATDAGGARGESPDGAATGAEAGGEAATTTAETATAQGSGPAGDEPTGRDRLGAAAGGLRLFDADSGELAYDSRQPRETPATVSEDAQRVERDGLALHVDPAADVLLARLRAGDPDTSGRYVAEYVRGEDEDDLVAAFVRALAEHVDDLGVEFVVDVAGEGIGYEQLRDPGAGRPETLSGADVEWLCRSDGPLDFVSPDGAVAFELAAYFREQLGDDRSVAVCSSGRTDALAATDVVVTPDPDCGAVEPRGVTATGLADRRLQERLTDVGAAVEAMVRRIDDVTGSVEARQRLFAAALSGGALAERGLAAVPVDDDIVGRRRRQARYLALYTLLLAGLAWGAHVGRFDPLAALPSATYRVGVGPLAGTPLADLPFVRQTYAVDGGLVVGGSLAATVGGAYWLFGHPLGPLAAAGALAGTIRRQVTGGVGSGTVPATVRELSDPVTAGLDDLEAAYERLADEEGTIAARADDFAAFVEGHLLARPAVPQVELVGRGRRWRRLLVGVVRGALVGTVAAGAVLGVLRLAVQYVREDPTAGLEALLGVAAVALVASVLKALALRFGRGRPPRWLPVR